MKGSLALGSDSFKENMAAMAKPLNVKRFVITMMMMTVKVLRFKVAVTTLASHRLHDLSALYRSAERAACLVLNRMIDRSDSVRVVALNTARVVYLLSRSLALTADIAVGATKVSVRFLIGTVVTGLHEEQLSGRA